MRAFFPSCGAFNPALTIAANALRVGDHLINDVFKSNYKDERKMMDERLSTQSVVGTAFNQTTTMSAQPGVSITHQAANKPLSGAPPDRPIYIW